MGINHGESNIHWNFYTSAEDDLEKISRYIEFSEENFQTYSIEIARLYLNTCSEIDVLCKMLCEKINPNEKRNNILDYQCIILNTHPNIHEEIVLINRFGLELNPWKNWNADAKPPYWWTSHNKVKHERNNHYQEANLKNLLNAISGLFILINYYYRYHTDKKRLDPIPRILSTRNDLAGIGSPYSSPPIYYFPGKE